jgi:ADP-heptose:LPS heptosyltransferase
MAGSRPHKYSRFVFFSAGPVGDHVILIAIANQFFASTGIPSIIVMKHNNPFLSDFALPYKDHISYVPFTGHHGKLSTVMLALKSIFLRYCYVNVLPIPAPTYYKMFAYYIRFCTRSRFVGFNLEGSRNFPTRQGSSSFLGESNYIKAEIDTKLFYEEANRMLAFLGYDAVTDMPRLEYIDHPEVLSQHGLKAGEYLVIHMQASHPDRSFPTDRWNHILKEIRSRLPEVTLVLTGSQADEVLVLAAAEGVTGTVLSMCGKVATQELLTLHAHAKLNVTVHTGSMHFINLLHVPTVTINIKGIYFFKPYYNEQGTELVSTKGCMCDQYERECNMITHHGVKYMACLFHISDEEVVRTIASRYYAPHS